MDYTDFAAYGRVVLKYLWLILIIVVVTVGATYYLASSEPPVYRAAVVLQINPFEPEEVALFTQQRTPATADLIKSTRDGFSAVVTSRTVALKAIADLGLSITPEDLLSHVSLGADDTSEFVSLNVEAQTSQAAGAIANKLVDNALVQYRQDRSRNIVAQTDFIQQQLKDADNSLNNARSDFLKFKLTNNVDSLDRQLNAVQDQVAQLRAQRDQATLEVVRAEASATYLEKQAQDAKTQMDDAANKSLTSSTEFYRAQLANFAGQAAAQRSSAAGQKALIDRLSQTISQREADITTLLGLTIDAQRMNDAVKAAQDQRDSLATKLREAEIKRQQALTAGYLQVVDAARTPQAPVRANVRSKLQTAGGASLLVGIALAFALEWLTQAGRSRRKPVVLPAQDA